MDISIIILNYKSRGLTLNCLESIKEADFRNLKYEIIVVDNNSEDSIGEILNWQYPDIKFIQNDKNLGMGAGNNVGVRQAQGKYIVIMNPDTISFGDTFSLLHGYMENNSAAGVAGPLQFSPDKTIQASCFRWPGLMAPVYRRTFIGKYKFAQKDLDSYLMKDFDHKSERTVDWLLGSFLFIRSKALDKIGLFDDRFFMYLEDTDLCRRFWQNGWQVIYYPAAKIIHNHLRESAKIPWYKAFISPTARYHIISWIKYLRKWGIRQSQVQKLINKNKQSNFIC
ncbi:MAG: glycosyltransferase family 2 protein [Patescibacteria group bacterium]|nr:glycosyltransferase family 2 protein [Patescibacteria group bacterium]